MKLLIMGAGYVGMALLKYLQDQPYAIYLTTTSAEKVPLLKTYSKNVLVLQQGEDAKLQEYLALCDAMAVLVAPKNSQSYAETYLHTAQKIAAELKQRQRPLYLIYTSSTSVCEGLQGRLVTEDMPLQPESENARILLETENVYLHSKARACILRLGGIYGPQRELLDRAKRLSGKTMPGTGAEPTNNIHLEDIVAAIAFCLTHSLTGVFHLVNDDHRTRKALYDELCHKIHLPPPVWNPELTSAHAGSYTISNQKIKAAGFSFEHPMT